MFENLNSLRSYKILLREKEGSGNCGNLVISIGLGYKIRNSRVFVIRRNFKKKGVSYSYRTAQPITFAYFRTWRVLGSWSYETYPSAKVEKYLIYHARNVNLSQEFYCFLQEY